jgi:hypothetical protein
MYIETRKSLPDRIWTKDKNDRSIGAGSSPNTSLQDLPELLLSHDEFDKLKTSSQPDSVQPSSLNLSKGLALSINNKPTSAQATSKIVPGTS